MLNVYLDDCRNCYDSYEGMDGWEHWLVVRSTQNLKKMLELGLVDDLDLDHDLGRDRYGNLLPDGTDLVKWIVETGYWPKGEIIVHSANKERNQFMRDYLRQAEEAGLRVKS
jgi:hypothetical protein